MNRDTFQSLGLSRKRGTRAKLEKLGRYYAKELGLRRLPLCTVVDLAADECLAKRKRTYTTKGATP